MLFSRKRPFTEVNKNAFFVSWKMPFSLKSALLFQKMLICAFFRSIKCPFSGKGLLRGWTKCLDCFGNAFFFRGKRSFCLKSALFLKKKGSQVSFLREVCFLFLLSLFSPLILFFFYFLERVILCPPDQNDRRGICPSCPPYRRPWVVVVE